METLQSDPHDHNPVHDAMGNVEAFQKIKEIAKLQRGDTGDNGIN